VIVPSVPEKAHVPCVDSSTSSLFELTNSTIEASGRLHLEKKGPSGATTHLLNPLPFVESSNSAALVHCPQNSHNTQLQPQHHHSVIASFTVANSSPVIPSLLGIPTTEIPHGTWTSFGSNVVALKRHRCPRSQPFKSISEDLPLGCRPYQIDHPQPPIVGKIVARACPSQPSSAYSGLRLRLLTSSLSLTPCCVTCG
jgi:hypothetical protein